MLILLLGSTGMLGRVLLEEGKKKGYEIVGLARSKADINLDITGTAELLAVFKKLHPAIVINTVADISVDACENNPGLAYCVNARPLAFLAAACKEVGAYLVQISTDHYYVGEPKEHLEEEPVILVNEYARTKYAAEGFALTCPGALAVRTNIVGFKGQQDKPTFVEWAIDSLQRGLRTILFSDYYTSSIDVRQFSGILYDLLEQRPEGVLNVGCRESFSKKIFIESLASYLSLDTSNCREGKIGGQLAPLRANSLGLNVHKAEGLLGYHMPSLDNVLKSLVFEYLSRNKVNL